MYIKSFSPLFESSNLPLIFINTYGLSIVDEERIVAHMGIIDNGEDNRNYIDDDFNDYEGLIAIELRGSSSSAYPKPQFRFETQDSSGENLNVSLCGLPKENDWILYGPYNDKSLIRNVLSYSLSNKLGRYASRTVFCELFLNEEYLGLYILMEKIKRDKNRVNISEMTPLDNSGDELTGGYIVKIDKTDGENVGLWFSRMGTPFQYHYPKADVITEQQKNYIESYLNDFEELMNSDKYNDEQDGYTNFIDVDSFVDHFILNEFCKNVDAYRLSAYLYKDRNSINSKLVAGPIWDFNLTFGDAWIPEEMYLAEGWQVDYSNSHPWDPFKVPFWWKKLSQNYEFVISVKSRWFDLRDSLFSTGKLFAQIDSLVEFIKEGSERNFERWPQVLSNSHQKEILILKGWIIRRLNWMDVNLGNSTGADPETGLDPEFNLVLFQNYPNPFNPYTTIKYVLPGFEEKSPEHTKSDLLFKVSLKVYDLLGNELVTLVNQFQPAGSYAVEFLANAENLRLSSGIYIYKLQVASNFNSQDYIISRKMVYLK